MSIPNAQLPEEQLYDVDVAPQTTDPAKVARVIDEARKLLRYERRVDWAEKLLKRAKARKADVATRSLPGLMKDANVGNECPLGNGWTVELNTLVTASVPSPDGKAVNARERHERGIAYLDDVAPDLVKHVAMIYFARGNEDQLKKLLRNAAKYKPPMEVEVKASVHAQTLGKWVRDQDAAGKAVDEVALGVTRIPTAELVPPKKDKAKI